MQHDDVPLPTNKYRRRSLFENESEEESKTVQIDIPLTKSDVYYPVEYIEKVRLEIEQWKMHITKTLDEKQKFRAEKVMLQNTVVDENILSAQQQDFFASLNFDGYMRRVEKFCDRMAILAYKIEYKPEIEIRKKCLAIEGKIKKDILEKHFK